MAQAVIPINSITTMTAVSCMTDLSLAASPKAAGDVLAVDSVGMLVACGAGAVRVLVVQPSGKRKLEPLEWSRGRGVAVGNTFDVPGSGQRAPG